MTKTNLLIAKQEDVITRQVDELGRIFTPFEFRKELGLTSKENIKAYLSKPDENGIFTVDFNHPKPNSVILADIGCLFIQRKFKLTLCTLDMWIENDKLKLKKATPQCILSGDTVNLVRYKSTDIYISRQTIRDLYEILLKAN